MRPKTRFRVGNSSIERAPPCFSSDVDRLSADSAVGSPLDLLGVCEWAPKGSVLPKDNTIASIVLMPGDLVRLIVAAISSTDWLRCPA